MTISPILDQPQSIDYAALPDGPIARLANHEIACLLDANCDPLEITWPWAGQVYARSVRLRVIDWLDGELVPLVTRFFPGHQETIAGTEGVIITRRLAVPYKTTDDRSLFWLLECQAEGDRVLRLEIDIEWNEPLSQRIVDGLLVAQRNPGPARGLYQQSNAESTRIFGNPYGRPDTVELDDPQRARLVYHVLVNGIVEVPLILTVSDVGEQMAWNTFLSLRDVEQMFDVSTRNWERRLHAGRLWTPDPAFNLAVEQARLAAIRHTQRLRTGTAPSDRRVERIPALVDVWDSLDPVQSRNLLAHLRRVAEATEGRLPAVLPAFPGSVEGGSDDDLLGGSTLYLHALLAHVSRHRTTDELLAEHMPGVSACADTLVHLRATQPARLADGAVAARLAQAMTDAARLAERAGDAVNAARWESEAAYLGGPPAPPSPFDLLRWERASGWEVGSERPYRFADDWQGMCLASAALWQGVGLVDLGDRIAVEPAWPQAWSWWALLGAALTEMRFLSLVWDGRTLHTTRPVTSSLPVQVHKRIQLLHIGEFDFNPVFEMISESGDSSETVRFQPEFQQSS
ncbi:MAG: hypothetical protein M9936_10745 [Caldilinea sp.]|nr:hypothetical protein [Caldilinea sp.]